MTEAILDPTEVQATKPALLCIMCKVPLCTFCNQCENAECMLLGKSATSKSELIALKHLLATTQKARGYVVIADVLNVPKPFRVISDIDDIDNTIKSMAIPDGGLFVRPCPVRPRHGFVESRALRSTDKGSVQTELREVFAEARKADPESELLLVPTIKATHNVILTPTRLAVGVGNDGATAGKKSTVFPLAGVAFHELPVDLVKKAGVGAEEDPYIEVVLTGTHCDAYSVYKSYDLKSLVYFTQLRAGVRISPAVDRDFIPDRMKVEKVLEASGDLLEWERQVKEEIKPGTAVYHLGGTLISHYGVHCVYNNIPIFTSRIPRIDEVLMPTAKPDRPSAESIARGLAIGAGPYIGLRLERGHPKPDGYPLTVTCNEATSFLLTASHNAAAMGGDNGTWIGIAASLMMRLGMAASHGEARHKGERSIDRSKVYKLALNDFFAARETLGHAQWKFKNMGWSSGYGGKKWAQCTDSIFRLDKAAQAVLKDKSDESITELVTALHNAINQAHNGGWWLNKFVQQEVFDHTSRQSMYSLSLAAPTILGITNLEIKDEDVQKVIDNWATASAPKIVQGISINGTVPASTVDDDEPEDDADDNDDEDGSTCGNPECTDCYPKDSEESTTTEEPTLDPGKGNVTGKIKVPEVTKILEAQGRPLSPGKFHIQYKLADIEGYLSLNVYVKPQLTEGQLQAISKHSSATSWSGSGIAYLPLDCAAEGTNWIFSHKNVEGVKFTCKSIGGP